MKRKTPRRLDPRFRDIDAERRRIALLEEANRQQRALDALRRQDERERLEVMAARGGWLSD